MFYAAISTLVIYYCMGGHAFNEDYLWFGKVATQCRAYTLLVEWLAVSIAEAALLAIRCLNVSYSVASLAGVASSACAGPYWRLCSRNLQGGLAGDTACSKLTGGSYDDNLNKWNAAQSGGGGGGYTLEVFLLLSFSVSYAA